MTTTNELIQAIASGDAMGIETAFNTAMAEKIAVKLDAMRLDVAKSMFNPSEQPAQVAEPAAAE